MKVAPAVILVALALSACADNSPGGKAAHERHQHFEEIGDAFKGINDQLKAATPDLAAIKSDAAKLAALAPQVKTWFPAGSGPQDGKRTDALEAVWTKPAEFDQAASRLLATANALKAAADTGDTAAIGAVAKTTGAACKGCHDKFKED